MLTCFMRAFGLRLDYLGFVGFRVYPARILDKKDEKKEDKQALAVASQTGRHPAPKP